MELKPSRHSQTQENTIHSQEKKEDPQTIQTLESADKNIKTAIINTLRNLREKMNTMKAMEIF